MTSDEALPAVEALPRREDLRRFVHRALCSRDRLEPQATPLREAVITRAGRPCGLFFQIEGPRLLRTYAVWAGDESRLLFYDSTGLRFAEVRLSESPDPRELKAA
jgi:hypothetical protein